MRETFAGPGSAGQVEAQIAKRKFVKRQMRRGAKLDLSQAGLLDSA